MTECDKCDTKLGFFTENKGSEKCEECEKGSVFVNTVVETKPVPVVETKPVQTKEVIHHVLSCNQCGKNWCIASEWKKNIPNVEKDYETGSDVTKWGCDNAKTVTNVIRNSVSGAIYAIETSVK